MIAGQILGKAHPGDHVMFQAGKLPASCVLLPAAVWGLCGGGRITLADEAAVDAALAKGDIESARRIALRWAPVVEGAPNAKRPPPGPSQVHLRCRAKVYIAMKKWKLALADVDRLVDRQRRADAGLSLESPDLLEALRLQATVHEKLGIDNGTGREER